MKKIIVFCCFVFVALSFAQKHFYLQVKIGTQTWMAENSMEYVDDSWCIRNDEETCMSGRLYTWEAAQKACPEGWHLPSVWEWEQLLNFAKGEVEGNLYAGPLMYEAGWRDAEYDYRTLDAKQGSDLYGFSVKPFGYVEKCSSPKNSYACDYEKEVVHRNYGKRAYFWTSIPGEAVRFRSDNDVEVKFYNESQRDYYGFSVRCVLGPDPASDSDEE